MSDNPDKPICIGCGKTPDQIPEYIVYGRENGMSAIDFCRTEEGTYNPETNHFACTDCYIKMGSPSSLAGWKAP